MTIRASHHESSTAREGDRCAGVVFWGLLLLAAPVFAMCILAPEWRTYEAMRVAERVEQDDQNLLKQRLARLRQDLRALRQDPAVVARLARRDLGYRRIGERYIPVTLTAQDAVPASQDSQLVSSNFGGSEEDHPDGRGDRAPVVPWPHRWAGLLPDYAYDRVFCAEPTRTIVFVMSTALIAIAYALFWRRWPNAS